MIVPSVGSGRIRSSITASRGGRKRGSFHSLSCSSLQPRSASSPLLDSSGTLSQPTCGPGATQVGVSSGSEPAVHRSCFAIRMLRFTSRHGARKRVRAPFPSTNRTESNSRRYMRCSAVRRAQPCGRAQRRNYPRGEFVPSMRSRNRATL